MGNKSCIFSTDDECIICKERKIDTLFLPCGHFGILFYILSLKIKFDLLLSTVT